MAKRLFLIAAGAIALTACTSQDVIEDVVVKRNAIQFENVVNKPSRAASELDNSSLKQFNVFGFYTLPGKANVAHEVFHNVAVTTTAPQADNTDWTYEGATRYWVKDAKYYFYAYSCGNDSKLSNKFGSFTVDMADNKAASERTLQIDGYQSDFIHQHDLVFASNTGTDGKGILGKDKDNDLVNFQFKHILSKIKAKFTTQFPSEYEVVITNVKISGINNIGDYDFKNGWTDIKKVIKTKEGETEAPTDTYVELGTGNDGLSVFNRKVNDKQMSKESEIAFTIPCDYENTAYETTVKLTFDVEVKYNGNFVLKKEGLESDIIPIWNPGYAYVYNVDISPSNSGLEEIKFSTNTDEFSDWQTAEDIDVEL